MTNRGGPVFHLEEQKQQFEHIVLQYTGRHPQDEIIFPYVTYAYNFKKIDPK